MHLPWTFREPHTSKRAAAIHIHTAIYIHTNHEPQVLLPGGDGKKGSLFDQLEDMDFDECLAKLKEIGAAN